MYIWELFGVNETGMLLFLSLMMMPILIMWITALCSNPYWIKLNNRQRNYWIIASITGTLIPLQTFFIIVLSIVPKTISSLDYYAETENLNMILLIGLIVLLINILNILDVVKYKKMNKIYGYCLGIWKQTLKDELGINLSLKEEKAGENNEKA